MDAGEIPRIITFTGASGAGKTTVARALLAQKSTLKILTSTTTRKKRESDLAGEYEYVRPAKFRTMQKKNAFLWTVETHGFSYGTRRDFVDAALNDSSHIYLMLLVPDILPILRDYAHGRIRHFFLTIPDPEVLRARLVGRGDGEGAVARRLADCKTWEQEARDSSTPYIFVANDGTVDEAVARVTKILE